MSGDRAWQPYETAPTDGTLFDAKRNGVRFTDCKIQGGKCVRMHGYPAVTTVFGDNPTHWMPRPEGLLNPYETNEFGEKFIP